MFKKTMSMLTVSFLVLGAGAQAQQFEVVHMLNYQNGAAAKAALDALFADDAMKGGKATLYAYDAGDMQSTHFVVEDFDGYDARVRLDDSRRASHGWSKYLLATPDAEYVGSEIVMVVDDHGKARHTADYLIAYLIHTTDAAAYREAVKDLHEGVGDPGVLRLVALRTGNRAATHAVLIGGKDFAAVNKYMDKLLASDAYRVFAEQVGDIRKVVGVNMYRRIGGWGY